MLNSARHHDIADDWNWRAFKGSQECLRQNRRDLDHLALAMRHTEGRNVAVQAGSNLGIFPKRMALDFAAVYTFEPEPSLFLISMANAPEPNIIRFQAGLGASPDFVSMEMTRQQKKHLPPHEGVTHVAGVGIIPIMQIDSLRLRACDLIYLDIEGWELFALEGAVWTIKEHRPTIALEINDCCKNYGIAPDDVRKFVEGLGYHCAATIRGDEIFVPVERK